MNRVLLPSVRRFSVPSIRVRTLFAVGICIVVVCLFCAHLVLAESVNQQQQSLVLLQSRLSALKKQQVLDEIYRPELVAMKAERPRVQAHALHRTAMLDRLLASEGFTDAELKLGGERIWAPETDDSQARLEISSRRLSVRLALEDDGEVLPFVQLLEQQHEELVNLVRCELDGNHQVVANCELDIHDVLYRHGEKP